ncbi:HET-domain-containing protein [Xylariaceae sp. FL1272]|nr:HET-domain-containing protein [Xylariaceae sp. FL1272]
MRLLEEARAGECSPTEEKLGGTHPPYAILSHTWGKGEVPFEDVANGRGSSKMGYNKLRLCGEQARRDNLKCFWIQTLCYVYLSDSRGWTLQELIAPRSVEFFSREGQRLGDKKSLERQIAQRTNITVLALHGTSLAEFNIDVRFGWAKNRETTREEDWAYSLFGIFGVFMPLLYGEGRENAVLRLRRTIKSKQTATATSVDQAPEIVLSDELEWK